ncbi:MAG: STAS domain-containing protein [Planctomycetes bacterium]|nr:STAS domain-containing protein [Planctomycetota bacterium]
MAAFHVDVTHTEDEVALLRVSGYLDLGTAPDLEDAVNRELDDGYCDIVVDLSRVDYISSAGVGVIIRGVQDAREEGGNLVLLRPSKPVMNVLDTLGASRLFRIVQILSDAYRYFDE